MEIKEMTDYEMGFLDYQEGITLDGADWDLENQEDVDYVAGWKAAEEQNKQAFSEK